MAAYIISISLIYSIVSIKYLECISISGIVDTKNPNNPLLLLPNMKKPQGVRSEGIFERFLRNFLDVLSTGFSGRKLTRYCRLLSKHLEDLNYRHTHKLAKHVRYLSRMYRDDLQNELSSYRQELDNKLPRRTEFLEAMNSVFTLQENRLLDDYIYELKEYGAENKPFIDDETRKVLNNVIVGSVLKMSYSDQKELLRKLRRAIKEY